MAGTVLVGTVLAGTVLAPGAPDDVAQAWLVRTNTATVSAYNIDKPLPPASLTKVMTALLLLGALLASGNDACLALAEWRDGSESKFVARMNQRAAALGLGQTHFANACGHDAPGHYSTAQDLAKLAEEALKNPVFADMVRRQEARFATVDGARLLHVKNSNALIGLVVAALWQWRERRWLGFGILWFFVWLLSTNPVLPRTDVANDRQLYLAMPAGRPATMRVPNKPGSRRWPLILAIGVRRTIWMIWMIVMPIPVFPVLCILRSHAEIVPLPLNKLRTITPAQRNFP